MKKENLILLFLVFSFLLWIAGDASRLILSSEMLSGKNFAFTPPASLNTERMLYSLLSKSIIIGLIGFTLTVPFAIFYLNSKKYILKNEGWLLISIVLFTILLPIELFTFWLDYKFIISEMTLNIDINELRKLFVHRIYALAGAPYMTILSVATIIIMIIFKPLKKTLYDS
ncbi:MAG: hypothetical protein O3A55_05340 [Bacteroidetes bacterium]|nr:hypothetical protein [Bacteroidota bacterium]